MLVGNDLYSYTLWFYVLLYMLITELLQKDPKDLAMNQSDNYRAIQEDRYIVDRTIPATGYGKGCKYHCISIQ